MGRVERVKHTVFRRHAAAIGAMAIRLIRCSRENRVGEDSPVYQVAGNGVSPTDIVHPFGRSALVEDVVSALPVEREDVAHTRLGAEVNGVVPVCHVRPSPRVFGLSMCASSTGSPQRSDCE